jgi:hypothetical protein
MRASLGKNSGRLRGILGNWKRNVIYEQGAHSSVKFSNQPFALQF